jgi:hypothetical protein
MLVRILIAGLCLMLAVGCAKRAVKKPAADDPAAKPTTHAPAAGDRDRKKDAKDDGPNLLTDPRFKTDPNNALPAETPVNGKPSWGFSAPEGGWAATNTGAPPGAPGAAGAPAAGAIPPQPVPATPPAAVTPTPALKPVSEADMKDVWVYVENASAAGGKMPNRVAIYQALVAAKSPAAERVGDGSIHLTGATTRESVWAFETKALTGGGLVATQTGVETLTAAELQKRLGK